VTWLGTALFFGFPQANEADDDGAGLVPRVYADVETDHVRTPTIGAPGSGLARLRRWRDVHLLESMQERGARRDLITADLHFRAYPGVVVIRGQS